MDRVKPSLKITLVTLPLMFALANWAWTQGNTRIRSQGNYAEYNSDIYYYDEQYNNLGNSSARVFVTEGIGTGGTYFNYLSFSVSYSVAGDSGYAYGYGSLQPGWVIYDNLPTRGLTLSVDTALLDFVEKSENMEYPSINLRWDRNSQYWNRTEGHQLRNVGPLVYHMQGTSVRYSADVQGTITLPPIPLPDVTYESSYVLGWIGSNKDMFFTILRGPK